MAPELRVTPPAAVQGQQGASGSKQQVSGPSLPRNSLLQSRGNRDTSAGQVQSPVAADDANGGAMINTGFEEFPGFQQQVRRSLSMQNCVGSLYIVQ